MELALGYAASRFRVDGNLTWQRVLNSQNFTVFNHSVYNIPDVQANLSASYEILSGLKLQAHANFVSSQKSLYSLPGMDPLDIDIPARVIVDAGISYAVWKLEFGLNAYNVANTNYQQGGSSVAPMRQAGLWLLGHIRLKI